MRKALIAAWMATVFALVSFQSLLTVSAEPDKACGDMYQVSSETISVTMAGDNKIVVKHNVWQVAGDLQGELVSEPRVLILTTAGEVMLIESAVFSGTWKGLEGTFTLSNRGEMVGPGLFHIECTITNGNGEFTGMYGMGSIDVNMNTSPPSATYSFELYLGA
jgi:hypothetical protein